MSEFQLKKLFTINGLGAASGLIYDDGMIYAIGDNSTFLYQFDENTGRLQKFPLQENAQDQIAKSDKPDFESITKDEDNLYIFGSGSTKNRNVMVQFDKESKKIVGTLDMSDLYGKMKELGQINPEDFNIEGAVKDIDEWFFFNRGNTTNQRNVIFSVKADDLSSNSRLEFRNLKLPEIKDVTVSFTDATSLKSKLYFLATAEDTLSTYDDGEILGSCFGRIHMPSMKIDYVFQISEENKFEGLTLYEENSQERLFLLCEDTDTDVQESDIYMLTIKKSVEAISTDLYKNSF
jgi:hypothetical protein